MTSSSGRQRRGIAAARLAYLVGAPLLRLKNRLTRLVGARSLGVQAVVCRRDSGVTQLLLVRQTYADGWTFPGGGVKSRETPIDAVRRELREETGVVALETPALFGVYLHQYLGLDDYVLLYRLEDFRIEASRSWEIAELRWCALDDLPADIRPACRDRIGEMFHDRPRADCW